MAQVTSAPASLEQTEHNHMLAKTPLPNEIKNKASYSG